jgi:hypothetical protein
MGDAAGTNRHREPAVLDSGNPDRFRFNGQGVDAQQSLNCFKPSLPLPRPRLDNAENALD